MLLTGRSAHYLPIEGNSHKKPDCIQEVMLCQREGSGQINSLAPLMGQLWRDWNAPIAWLGRGLDNSPILDLVPPLLVVNTLSITC